MLLEKPVMLHLFMSDPKGALWVKGNCFHALQILIKSAMV